MIFLGDIPPPLHGMSAINKQMLALLEQQTPTIFINTSPSCLARYYHSPFWLLIKIVYFFPVTFRLLWSLSVRRERVLYRALNGGSGQIFDFCWLWLARQFGAKLYLHHHAALYLTSPSDLFARVCRAAGETSCHIVLGEAMQVALVKNYGVSHKNIRILSNAAFFEKSNNITNPESEHEILKIGYLANISLSKGIDVFLETLMHLKARGGVFEAFIAGPCYDSKLASTLDEACVKLPELRYLGGLYDEDKSLFFTELNCFIYPSRNEAEPLVIYEAAVEGSYILSSETGCMKATTQLLNGWSMPLESTTAWADSASKHLLQSAPSISIISRKNRKQTFQIFAANARITLDSLIKEIAYAKA